MIEDRVADQANDNPFRARARALYEWLTGPPPSGDERGARETLPARIGQYAITRKLGEGGMGVCTPRATKGWSGRSR
jgi:hypothetical protein